MTMPPPPPPTSNLSPDLPDGGTPDESLVANALGRLKPPAIIMIVLASIGLLATLYGLVDATLTDPAAKAEELRKVAEGAPPEMRKFIESMAGMSGANKPVAIVVNLACVLGNVITILGAVGMLRGRNLTLAFVGSVVAALNIGGCCCFLQLAPAIWAMVVLSKPEVRAVFARR